jgi:hypothetical protein
VESHPCAESVEHDSTTSRPNRADFSTTGVGTYAKHEAELVPATVVVRLIDC